VPAEFVKQPVACLTLASFLATNTGDVARKHINDPELLSFIDIECYCWSTVLAGLTPMMNAGMVFCDRHYGGINYPKGGVGRIAQALAGEGWHIATCVCLAFMVCCMCAETMQAVCLIHVCHALQCTLLIQMLAEAAVYTLSTWGQGTGFLMLYICNYATAHQRTLSALGCAVLCQQQPLWVVQELQNHHVPAEKAGTCADTIAAMAVDLQTRLLENIQSIYQSIYLMSWGATGTQQTRSSVP